MLSFCTLRTLVALWLFLSLLDPKSPSLYVSATPISQTVFSLSGNDHVPLQGKHGAVACEADICSRIGIDINEAGGNAADMITATTLCIGVVAMYHAGIGGGGFALVHLPNGTQIAVDFRETAPTGSNPEMWKDQPLSQLFGGLSAGIPGELRGLEYIHTNFGKLPWETVVAPAVRLAKKGFEVNSDLERYMNVTVERLRDYFSEDPVWAEDFAPNGTRLGLGDWISRPKLGIALERIGREGASVFYEGEMAEQIVATNRKHGGLFTREDMRNYKVQVREPISIDYGDYTVTSVPAPAGGASVVSILKIMEGFDFADGANLTMHRLNEAFRFAYGGRAIMGDPAFVDRIDELERKIITEEYAKEVRAKMSDEHTLAWKDYTPSGFETRDSHGTSHLIASDSSGLAISLTSTVNLYFGSGVMVPETGIILNDQMADFSTPYLAPPFYRPPSVNNFALSGKRPLSACSPTIVTRRQRRKHTDYEQHNEETSSIPILALGAAGGSRIVTLIASLLLTFLPPHLPHPNIPSSSSTNPPSLRQILALPRIHDSLTPNETSLEYGQDIYGIEGFNNGTAAFLMERGHQVSWVEPHYSAAQMVAWDCSREGTGNGEGKGRIECGFVAASDPRHRIGGARVR